MTQITRDEYGNINEDCITLDPRKVFEAVKSGQPVLGKDSKYWAIVITEHAQSLSDEATIDQYDDWDIEALGYDF